MLNIPASIEVVDFSDKRSYVSTGQTFNMPTFSKPGQFIEYYPEFNSTHKRLVFDLIHQSFDSHTAKAFKVNIELIEGVKEFSATFSKETERAKIRLRIILVNETDKFTTEASGEYYVSSVDARYKRFEELYQRTLQSVTYAGLLDLKSKYFVD